MAGYRAFALRHAPGDLTPEAQVTLREQVLADLDQHLTYYWNSLDPEAQYALAALPLLERGARPPALERLRAAGLLFETSETLEISEVLMGFVRRQKVDGLLQAGEFILDLRRGLVAARGQTIHLTPTEFAALRLFLERPGQMLTAEGIEAALWPGEVSPDTDRARGIVKKLRNALGPAGEALENRRGQGWWLNSGIGD